jgi:hypothetical protein
MMQITDMPMEIALGLQTLFCGRKGTRIVEKRPRLVTNA